MDKKAQTLRTHALTGRPKPAFLAGILLFLTTLACNFALPTPEVPTPVPTEINPNPPTLAPIRIEKSQTRIIATQPVLSIISTATATPSQPPPTETPYVDNNLKSTTAPLSATVTIEPETEPTKQPTTSPEENQLSLSYSHSWFINQDDSNEVIAKIQLTPQGGTGPYRFYWNDFEIPDAGFALDAKGCGEVKGALSVRSADGQRAEIEFDEFSPCG